MPPSAPSRACRAANKDPERAATTRDKQPSGRPQLQPAPSQHGRVPRYCLPYLVADSSIFHICPEKSPEGARMRDLLFFPSLTMSNEKAVPRHNVVNRK